MEVDSDKSKFPSTLPPFQALFGYRKKGTTAESRTEVMVVAALAGIEMSVWIDGVRNIAAPICIEEGLLAFVITMDRGCHELMSVDECVQIIGGRIDESTVTNPYTALYNDYCKRRCTELTDDLPIMMEMKGLTRVDVVRHVTEKERVMVDING